MGGAALSLVGVGLAAVGGFMIVTSLDGRVRSAWHGMLSGVLIVAGIIVFIIGLVR